jgi:hypothetical protein
VEFQKSNQRSMVPSKRRGQNRLQGKLMDMHNFAEGLGGEYVLAVHPVPRVFVLVVASDESDDSIDYFLSQRRTRT